MDWKTIAAEIERTATARGRAKCGRFSVEGFRLMERAARAGAPLRAALVAESLFALDSPRMTRLRQDLERAGCQLLAAPDSEVSNLLDGRDSGPIVGLVEIPQSPSLEIVAPAGKAARILVAIDVADPGNIGALVRTALVGGAAGFVSVGAGDPYHPRAVRISRGSLFRIPILRMSGPASLPAELRRCGFTSLAAVARGGEPLPRFRADAHRRWAICLGGEARGLPEGLVEAIDRRVSIPMADDVDSYSVHAAAAILLYALSPR